MGAPEPLFGPRAARARLNSMVPFFFIAYFMLIFVLMAATYGEKLTLIEVAAISTVGGASLTAVDYAFRRRRLGRVEARLGGIVAAMGKVAWWGFIGSGHPLLVVDTGSFSLLAQDTDVWLVSGGRVVKSREWDRKVRLGVYLEKILRRVSAEDLGRDISLLFSEPGEIVLGVGQVELPRRGKVLTYRDAEIVEARGLRTYFHKIRPEAFARLVERLWVEAGRGNP